MHRNLVERARISSGAAAPSLPANLPVGQQVTPARPMGTGQSLLLELPVPFRDVDGQLWVEAQVLNGLRLWSENFECLTVCAPVLPALHPDEASTDWADPGPLLAKRSIKLLALPWGYRHFDALRLASSVKATLGPLIDSHQYLCFGNVGGFGAWGNLGVELARQRGRRYSVWFDNVASEMPMPKAHSAAQAVKLHLEHHFAKFKTLQAIRHADLGLFHGRTVFDAYDPLCPHGELVHNIHCGPQDAMSEAQLLEKLARQKPDEVLRIGYAGRAHAIKGPFDWIDTLAELARRVGPERFKATWYGSGPLLDEARRRVERAGLNSRIRFAGHVRNRESLLLSLRQLDIFLFCHLTPESPRCLIESLISCTPLVGYDSSFARDLIGSRGGAELVPIGDVKALAAKLERLVNERSLLPSLTQAAATARPLFNDEAVFKHRSDLIKTHLRETEPRV